MEGDTTRSNAKQNLKFTSDAVEPHDTQADDREELSPVEKVLLGATPDDPIEVAAGPAASVLDARPARLEVIRSFLAEQPELRAKLRQEVDKAWHNTDRQRGEFLAALAERRAEVLSRAELSHLGRLAPQTVAGFRGELSRYLEMEGFGAGGGIE
jgi:hypothetical protein